MKALRGFRISALIVVFVFNALTLHVNGQVGKDESNAAKVGAKMKVRINANGRITIFELNESQAARDLYDQLPMNIEVEDYNNNERIFHPSKKLNTNNTPLADAKAGTLAYYAPWGDVVMFYADFGSAAGLYELGQAVSGGSYIDEIEGAVTIEKDPGS